MLWSSFTVWLLSVGGINGFVANTDVSTRQLKTSFIQPIHTQTGTRSSFAVSPTVRSSSFAKVAILGLAAASGEDYFVNAQDSDALQALFARVCADGLMTKEELQTVPLLKDLLSEEDLLKDELNDIWDAAPKFPDVEEKSAVRIDVDSFIQIYRDIDDLFDDQTEGNDAATASTLSDSTISSNKSSSPQVTNSSASTSSTTTTLLVATGADAVAAAARTPEDVDDDVMATKDEQELEAVFQTLCDQDGLISRKGVLKWDEVQKLLEDGLLGADELGDIWEKTAKYPGSNEELLDINGFLSLNVAVDDLFIFDEIDNSSSDTNSKESTSPPAMVTGEDLSPGLLFAELCDQTTLRVGMEELNRWVELQEMLGDGDLLPLELKNMYTDIAKDKETLNEEGFVTLFDTIDSLFESDDESTGATGGSETTTQTTVVGNSAKKTELLAMLDSLNSDEERLPCGIECTDGEQEVVLNIINDLQKESINMLIQKEGNIDLTDLAGTWILLFSSSATMKFNKGVSGLGGSFPNGKFGGLQQTLKANKYLTDMEYLEHIKVTPDVASFDVRINGDWELSSSISLFTGQPSTVMRVVPDRVMYGPTVTRADHWKSLGPLNSLDIAYLDDDLRVMRGNTATDNVFIFRKTGASS